MVLAFILRFYKNKWYLWSNDLAANFNNSQLDNSKTQLICLLFCTVLHGKSKTSAIPRLSSGYLEKIILFISDILLLSLLLITFESASVPSKVFTIVHGKNKHGRPFYCQKESQDRNLKKPDSNVEWFFLVLLIYPLNIHQKVTPI